MASAETTRTHPAASRFAGRAEARSGSLDAPTAASPTPGPAQDEYGGLLDVLAGCGVLLVQACAIIPGLLPCLALALPLVLGALAVGLAAGLLVGVALGIWRLAVVVWRPLRPEAR